MRIEGFSVNEGAAAAKLFGRYAETEFVYKKLFSIA